MSIRSVLLLPRGATNTKMGGGQRTALFFNALKQLGPVDVVILGSQPPKRSSHTYFPGAASQQWIPSPRFSTAPQGPLKKLRTNLSRFLQVRAHYAADREISSALNAILTKDHRLVVSRYALPFCVSGLRDQPGLSVFVDVDDRDDQKFESAGQAVLASALISKLFQRWIVPNIRKVLKDRLTQTGLLWYTDRSDAFDLSGPVTSVVPNVPFGLPAGDMTPISPETQDILFVGSFAHRPNQDGIKWFLKNCWPALSESFPKASLRVVGLGPWESLSHEFSHLTGVVFVGTVEDIAAEYERARLVISPVFDGGGSKIKVIEACAYGRPIVVSPHSARGFGADIEQALPKAEDAQGFVQACKDHLADPELAQKTGQHLRELQQGSQSQSAMEQKIINDILEHLC